MQVLIADHRLLAALRPRDPLRGVTAPGWLEATAREPHVPRRVAHDRCVAREEAALQQWLQAADLRDRRLAHQRALVDVRAAQRLWGVTASRPPYVYRGFGDMLTVTARGFGAAVARLFAVAPWWAAYGPARRDLEALVVGGRPVEVEAVNAWVRRQGDADAVLGGGGTWVCVVPDRLDVLLKLPRGDAPLDHDHVPLSVAWGDVIDGAKEAHSPEHEEALSLTGEPQSEWGDLNPFGHYLPFPMTRALRDHRVANPEVNAYTGAMTAPEGSQPIQRIRAVMDAAAARLPR